MAAFFEVQRLVESLKTTVKESHANVACDSFEECEFFANS